VVDGCYETKLRSGRLVAPSLAAFRAFGCLHVVSWAFAAGRLRLDYRVDARSGLGLSLSARTGVGASTGSSIGCSHEACCYATFKLAVEQMRSHGGQLPPLG
jgi:hypothetical protein